MTMTPSRSSDGLQLTGTLLFVLTITPRLVAPEFSFPPFPVSLSLLFSPFSVIAMVLATYLDY